MLSIGELRLGQVSPRTLRHYGDVGVLEPAHVDPATGYRYYEVRQLSVLRRALALRDLGVGLDQIRGVMGGDGELSVEQLRGMLRLRRADISTSTRSSTTASGELRLPGCARARRADANHRNDGQKETETVRMAESTGVADGFGHDNIGPVFQERLAMVWARLVEKGIKPGMSVAYYKWPDDTGHVVVHLGFDIGDQSLADDDEVRVVELPVVQVDVHAPPGPVRRHQ